MGYGAKSFLTYQPNRKCIQYYLQIAYRNSKRLKKVIHKLVDSHQMAFLKGGRIIDATLVANECVDTRMKERNPRALCKLDIRKAYDHVNWAFLIKRFKDMGFGNKWVNWVFFCIILHDSQFC